MKRNPRADLYRVVAARFLSRAGSEAAFFVGVWGKAAFDLSASATQLALLMLTMGIASIGGSFVAGAMVDRYGPRRVLAAAEIVFVPAALAVAFARDISTLTLLVGLWAFVGAPVVTAGASFAPFLRRGDLPLERINAWIEGAGSLSFAVGPAVGALLVRYASVDWVFVLDAATSLVAALLVWRVKITIPERSAATTQRHPLAEFTQGIKTVYAVRPLRYYVLVGSLAWFAFGAFGSLEPLFFRDVVGTGVETLGWINSVFGVGFVVGASLLPRMPRRIFSARGLAWMIALVGAGTVLYVGFPDLRIIAVGAFLWSAAIGLMEPLLRTLMHRDAPPGVLGRVMGTVEVHRRLGELIPLTVAPALAAAFGVQPVMIGGGIVAALIALFSLGEAAQVDRIVGRVGADPGEIQGIHTSDEPLSPNP
ncbi:MAG: MFS transporter [Coriobacteriia bacterium]